MKIKGFIMFSHFVSKSRITILQNTVLLIGSLFFAAVMLEIGLRLTGAFLLYLQEHRNIISLSEKGEYRILCLGESTTASGGEYSYPSQLEEILNKKIGLKASVINKGISGTDTSFIASHLEENINKYMPDMVITMMGINDYSANVPYHSMEGNIRYPFLYSLRICKLVQSISINMAVKLKKANKQESWPFNESGSKQILEFPQDSEGLIRKAWWYHKKKDYDSAIKTLKKALELGPQDYSTWEDIGWIINNQGNYPETERAFRKTIERLEWVLRINTAYRESEETFKKSLEVNPGNSESWRRLGLAQIAHEDYMHGLESLLKAIEINPHNTCAARDLRGLAYQYLEKNDYDKSEVLYRWVTAIDPQNELGYLNLAPFYIRLDRFAKAKAMLEKAYSLNPHNHTTCAMLAVVYHKMGNDIAAREYSSKADREIYKPATVQNYHKVKGILDRYGIKYVCVQYPMRSIEPFKKIFTNENDIIFVDNEEVFKDALKGHSYKDYFSDLFGGNFGHCTPKGNRLLAANIAHAILKNCFNK